MLKAVVKDGDEDVLVMFPSRHQGNFPTLLASYFCPRATAGYSCPTATS